MSTSSGRRNRGPPRPIAPPEPVPGPARSTRSERADAFGYERSARLERVAVAEGVGFLDRAEQAYSGFLVAAMALMESPAIVVGILLARWVGVAGGWNRLVHEALCNGAVLLLVGSMTIGFLTGEAGWTAMAPVIKDPFTGVLSLFLLAMGLVAARRLGKLKQAGMFLTGFSLVVPLLHGGLGIAVAAILGLSQGDAVLMAVLFASASYIAVPAAMRMALPQASPGLYLPMTLGLTFPMNVIVGIPLYFTVVRWGWEFGGLA